MEKIERILKKREENKAKGRVFDWQDLALHIIAELKPPKHKKPSIFKVCKQDKKAAQQAYIDCTELGKPYADYFFKVYSEIRKKYEQT